MTREPEGRLVPLAGVDRRIPEKGVHYSAARDITDEMESRGER